MRLNKLKMACIALVLCLLIGTIPCLGQVYKSVVPRGLGGFGIEIADGIFDPDEGDPAERTGEYFHRVIMGRSEVEMALDAADAKAYFKSQFGLDLTIPAIRDRLFFGPYMVDPRQNLRMYKFGEDVVPSSGWKVFDGGWNIVVTSPNGILLGGKFPGRRVPQGTIFLWGDYKIMTQRWELKSGREYEMVDGDPIFIRYRSRPPTEIDHWGRLIVSCTLVHEKLGGGLVEGYVAPLKTLADGRVQANIRATWTFPSNGRLDINEGFQNREDVTPDHLELFMNYMANGIWDPNDPHYTPPDGEYFHRVIRGRSEEEMAEVRDAAAAFFHTVYGVDVDAPEMQGRVVLEPFMFDPRMDIRAFTISGETIPPEGVPIEDGGFRMIVLDPDGITLGGDFQGVAVPQFTVGLFGEWVIKLPPRPVRFKRAAKHTAKREMIFEYRSGNLLFPNADGAEIFVCPARSKNGFGAGLFAGYFKVPLQLPDGRRMARVRGVVTLFRDGVEQ